MARPHSNRSAYTLVELVMLLGIIAVLAAIANPRYANSLALYRVQAAAQRIAADLNFARIQAKTSSVGQSVLFDVQGNTYSLPGARPLSGQSAYVVSLSGEPYSSALASCTYTSILPLSFDRYGQVSAGGSVAVRAGAFKKTVIIDAATGQVTIQ